MFAAPLLALSLALVPPLAQAEADVGLDNDFGQMNEDFQRIDLTPEQQANAEAAAGGIMAAAGGLLCVGLVFSLAALAAFIWVVVDVSKRPEMDTGMKVVWALVAWFVPILGPIIYYFVGRKPAAPASRV
ncbi:PLD nuclease N-terminal domain-containing protein [Alienimonas californiensis]|uniref:Cardiolipin synthase N-terminal domain-containing protein n=1 Tax=Alienimonas californiensis TaxID=2527989 RepID=A0A517P3U7_9PLAN|nr:PLD nuclease N-terminal domain-containing protein [Alienimonas californiensis]QDT14023.1 hypothetical protein CA12_00910 [Alienimonas californiensis]